VPNLNEFLNTPKADPIFADDRVEIIEQMRPCSQCDLFVHEYYFNSKSMEMYWTCVNGHKTMYKVG
jgi:hypothetical protein